MADRTLELARLHRRVRIRRTPSLLLAWPPNVTATSPATTVGNGAIVTARGGTR